MRLADGTDLHVVVDGPDDAPVTVVLVHGWTLDATTWGPVAALLARRGARVVRHDHRGHGRSSAVDPATMTLEQLADDLAAVVAETAPDGPLVLAGHSMGGMTLMALAERHPDVVARAKGIALVATAAGGLADTTFGLPAASAPVLRAVEERVYGSRRWAGTRSLGSPRALAPAMGIARYQQVHRVESPVEAALRASRGTVTAAYTGHAETWFDRSVPPGPESRAAGRRAVEDERTFIDLPRSAIWVGKEHVFIDRELS